MLKKNSEITSDWLGLSVIGFPGNALAAIQFAGELRGYDVVASRAGGNCVDFEHAANPYRFYGLRASGCANGHGINMFKSKSEEFHGASIFANNIDVSLTGARAATDAYVLFDGVQLQHSQYENMYLDSKDETLICAANCVFQTMNESGAVGGDSDSAIVIGGDVTTTTGLTPAILSLRQGYFDPGPSVVDNSYYDIRFDQNGGGHYCNCAVTLAPDFFDLYTGATANAPTGTPTTNYSTNVVGSTSYAPPLLGNAEPSARR